MPFWHKYVFERLRNESDIEFNQQYSNIRYRFGPGVPDCKMVVSYLIPVIMKIIVLLVLSIVMITKPVLEIRETATNFCYQNTFARLVLTIFI